MVLYRKIHMELRFTKEKNMVDYENLKKRFIIKKTIEVFQQIYNISTLIYYGKLWYCGKKKLWYNGRNYGTISKTMVLYRKRWNFDLLRKKLWYYGKTMLQ